MTIGRTMRALSDPNRRLVLETLKDYELPVGDILSRMNISGASLSHHLGVLKEAGLVSVRRDGQRLLYSINLSVAESAVRAISELLGKGTADSADHEGEKPKDGK